MHQKSLSLIGLFTLTTLAMPLEANIDLECSALSDRLVMRLAAEGLLADSPQSTKRARIVAEDLCANAESRAQDQHETAKQKALSNWLFESSGNKPGNKRLRNLKR